MIDFVSRFNSKLSGYRTYLGAATLVLSGVASTYDAVVNGGDIYAGMRMIGEGLTAAGFRASGVFKKD